MIDDYRFGSMTVQGQKHQSDLKIVRGKVLPRWWRREGHSMDVGDVDDILAARPDILVVGMGQPGRMRVTETLKAVLNEARIELLEEPTAEAVQTFNRLYAEKRNVAGAFHLTC